MDVFLLAFASSNIDNYLNHFSDLIFPSLACPRCKEYVKIIKHGYYYRRAIDQDEKRHMIPIQRFRCKSCKKTFSYLPPF